MFLLPPLIHDRRNVTAILILLVVSLPLFTAALDTSAHNASRQVTPTSEPSFVLQVPPTEEPDLPIAPVPTQTPTPPTRASEPPSGPDHVQVVPTAMPTEPERDLPLQAAPTEPGVVELPGEDTPVLPPSIFLHESLCDTDTSLHTSQSWQSFLLICSNPSSEVGYQLLEFEYTITGSGGYHKVIEDPSATGQNPIVVPVGTVTIDPSVPSGFADPVAVCLPMGYTPFTNPPPPEAFQWFTDGTMTLDLAPGDERICDVFHIPESQFSNFVTIHTWLCPSGTAQGMLLTDYLDTCSDQHNGVEFVLLPWSGGGVQMATTEGGQAHFESVALGHVAVEHNGGDAFSPVVFCGVTELEGGGIQHPAHHELNHLGQVKTFFEVPGTTFACHWFNIPNA